MTGVAFCLLVAAVVVLACALLYQLEMRQNAEAALKRKEATERINAEVAAHNAAVVGLAHDLVRPLPGQLTMETGQ